MPFYVRTGKRLARRRTEVVLYFKRTPQALFARAPEERLGPNQIALRIGAGADHLLVQSEPLSTVHLHRVLPRIPPRNT